MVEVPRRVTSPPPPPRVFPPNMPITSVKYPGEARVRAGACTCKVPDRQIKNITANLGTRCEGKIVGDTPEMCRALDSHGFCF